MSEGHIPRLVIASVVLLHTTPNFVFAKIPLVRGISPNTLMLCEANIFVFLLVIMNKRKRESCVLLSLLSTINYKYF